MKEITSLGNAVVKDVCNLKQKKYRERSGSFVVEGLRAVEEAVRYAAVQKVFAVPDTANTRLTQLLADAAAVHHKDAAVPPQQGDALPIFHVQQFQPLQGRSSFPV